MYKIQNRNKIILFYSNTEDWKIKNNGFKIQKQKDFQPTVINAAKLQIKGDGSMKAFFKNMWSHKVCSQVIFLRNLLKGVHYENEEISPKWENMKSQYRGNSN